MIDFMQRLAGLWWEWMVPMAWQVSVLILVLAAVDRAGRRWIWPQVRHALWLLVLVKLCLPPSWGSPVSVAAWLGPVADRAAGHVGDLLGGPGGQVTGVDSSSEAGNLDAATSRFEGGGPGLASGVPGADGLSGKPPALGLAAAWGKMRAIDGAFIAWLLAMASLLVSIVHRSRATRRTMLAAESRVATPDWLVGVAVAAAGRMGLRRAPCLVVSRRVTCPAVLGFVRPLVLVPAGRVGQMSEKEARCILLHEFGHVRRGDLLLHSAQLFLRVVYWFHPLLWIAERKLHHLRELCCDATVVRSLPDAVHDYRGILLESARRLVLGPNTAHAGALGLFEDAHGLVARLEWLERRSWRRAGLSKSVAAIVAVAILACVLPMNWGGVAAERPHGKDASAPVGRQEERGSVTGGQLTEECRRLLDEIRSADRRIQVYRAKGGVPVDKIDAEARELTQLCRDFLQTCGGSEGDGPTKAMLAGALLSRQFRVRSEWETEGLTGAQVKERVDRYLEEATHLAESAVGLCPARSEDLYTALLGLVRSYASTQRHEDLRRVAFRLIDEPAPNPLRGQAAGEVARSYMQEERFQDAVRFLRSTLEKYPTDPERVTHVRLLFGALTTIGDLEGLDALLWNTRSEPTPRVDWAGWEHLQARYEELSREWSLLSCFWLGFVRMAQRDKTAAIERFEEFIAAVDGRLSAKSESPDQNSDKVLQIYRDYRAKRLLSYLRDIQGTRPSVDLDSLVWATEEKPTLRDSTGKVVAILARAPGDARAASFLQALDRQVKEKKAQGLVGVTLTFLRPEARGDGRSAALEAMKQDLSKLSVSLPAGIDPDENAGVIRGLFAGYAGTSSFVIFDRRGASAWILDDPRDMDRALAARVIDHILAQ